MIWNSVTHEERLRHWKKLRGDIAKLPIQEQLNALAEFCESMPRSRRRTLDFRSFTGWPTPWEIIFHAEFCINSISLIIFYTLLMLDSSYDVELWVVKDNGGDYLLPVVNNQFVLNYEVGKVSNYSEICDYFIVMQKCSKQEIKTIK